MKDLASARALAKALVRVGTRAGKNVVALLTDMSTPIGTTIGNALETREAIEVLKGEGPEDSVELTLALGAEMLVVAGVEKKPAAARERLKKAIADGSGLEKLAKMVKAQGGDPRAIHDTSRLPSARQRVPVEAEASGWITECDALELGLTSVSLGAGRTRADQKIDPAVGIELLAKRGDRVEQGEPLCLLHVRKSAGTEAYVSRARNAFRIGPKQPKKSELVLERITDR
jgi:pyrimidine-nucleoside phosphorylase